MLPSCVHHPAIAAMISVSFPMCLCLCTSVGVKLEPLAATLFRSTENFEMFTSYLYY